LDAAKFSLGVSGYFADKVDAEILLEEINNGDERDAEQKDDNRKFYHPENDVDDDHKHKKNAGED
jgi:hypothetical protein